jgi:hypothetical protein
MLDHVATCMGYVRQRRISKVKVSLADVFLALFEELSVFCRVSSDPSLIDGFGCLTVHR